MIQFTSIVVLVYVINRLYILSIFRLNFDVDCWSNIDLKYGHRLGVSTSKESDQIGIQKCKKPQTLLHDLHILYTNYFRYFFVVKLIQWWDFLKADALITCTASTHSYRNHFAYFRKFYTGIKRFMKRNLLIGNNIHNLRCLN